MSNDVAEKPESEKRIYYEARQDDPFNAESAKWYMRFNAWHHARHEAGRVVDEALRAQLLTEIATAEVASNRSGAA